MRHLRISSTALGLLLAVLIGCTQVIDADGSQTVATPDRHPSALAVVDSEFPLPPDWSGNVRTRLFDCFPTGFGSSHIAQCTVPSDWVLVGGGLHVNYGEGDSPRQPGVLVTASYPLDLEAGTWEVRTKDHMFLHSHSLSASAIGLKVGNLSAAQLRGQMQVVEVTSWPLKSASEANATLPPGMLLVGGGAKANYGGAGNLLTASHPIAHGWRAAAKDHGILDPGSVTSYAIFIAPCLTGFGCLSANFAHAAASCDTGYCEKNKYVDPGWAWTSMGGASNYGGAGRPLTHLLPGIADGGPFTPFMRAGSKDHAFIDTGSLFTYVVELAQLFDPPGAY